MALKKRALLPPFIILSAILIVVVLSALKPEPPKRSNARPPALVDVLEVYPQDQQYVVAGQGNVMPKRMTTLNAQVSGQVIEVSDKYVNGGFFKQGETLIQIDPSDYRVAVQSAEASLAQARAALAEESARAKVAKEEWESLQLGEIPALGIREPQVASALAAVKSAEAALAKAQRDLERTAIKAPFAGILQNKNAELGQFITMNTQVGQLLGTDVAEVRVPLSDRDLAYLYLPEQFDQISQTPEVMLYSNVAGEAQRWRGHLTRSEGILDSNSRVIYGVVEVIDPYNLASEQHATPLRFGRFVQLDIEGIVAKGVYEVPRYAQSSNGNVWVVNDARELEAREVVIDRAEENTLYISEGLQPGDKVVLTQLVNALPGQKVRLATDPVPAQAELPNNPNEG